MKIHIVETHQGKDARGNFASPTIHSIHLTRKGAVKKYEELAREFHSRRTGQRIHIREITVLL